MIEDEVNRFSNGVCFVFISSIVIFAVFLAYSVAIADIVFKQGEDKIIVRYDKQINITLSSKGINHLHFENERIVKIIGDSSEYSAVMSGNGSDLFFTSKVKSGSQINLSIELSSGFIVDAIITVVKSRHPKIIFLERYIAEQDKQHIRYTEAQKMMQAMRSNEYAKYYVKQVKKIIKLPCRNNLKINQYVNYRYGNLRGAAFNIHNENRNNQVILKPRELAHNFKSVLCANIDNIHISPGMTTRGFIIWSVSDD